MKLFLGLYAAATGANSQGRGELLEDLSRRVVSLTFGTNLHGFADLQCQVELPLSRAFWLYDRPGLPHLELRHGAMKVWEGRLEDVAIIPGGLQLGAFGYWRAFYDVPYTALWSTTSVAEWFVGDDRIRAGNQPDRFNFDTNNRLYITPVKNSVLGNTGSVKVGRLMFALPHLGDRNILAITFDFAFRAPNASWNVALESFTPIYPIGSGLWTFINTLWGEISGNGAEQTGTVTVTSMTSAGGLGFYMHFNAADATYGSETGTDYLKITNLRVLTRAATTLNADHVASGLVTYLNAINSSQVQNVTGLVQSPGLDLRDELYEDALPADILTHLAALGDNQTPPRQWETGVWENRILHFRPKGDSSWTRTWYVDITALELERTLEALRNNAYALYEEAGGRTLRTPIAVNNSSVTRFGLTRRGAVQVRTTSLTQANVHRDAFLEDRRQPKPRAAIQFSQLYDSAGARWPAWAARAGDTIVMRNLPPALLTGTDLIRSFRCSETKYDAFTGVLELTPELPLPTLEQLMARQAAGIPLTRPRRYPVPQT